MIVFSIFTFYGYRLFILTRFSPRLVNPSKENLNGHFISGCRGIVPFYPFIDEYLRLPFQNASRPVAVTGGWAWRRCLLGSTWIYEVIIVSCGPSTFSGQPRISQRRTRQDGGKRVTEVLCPVRDANENGARRTIQTVLTFFARYDYYLEISPDTPLVKATEQLLGRAIGISFLILR